MMRRFIILLTLFHFFNATCQLTVSDIPDELKNGADAVFLLDQGEFTITEDDRAIFKAKQRIAILNGEGGKFAIMRLSYDKLRKVKSFDAERFDRYGKTIKKLKKSEIMDVSAISGFSIYEDNRLKIADLRQPEYPYIVEFEYEVEYKYLYYIPNWYPLPDDEVGVLRSSFKLVSPPGFEPRYKVENIEDRSKKEVLDGRVTVSFNYENLVPYFYESHQPRNVLPVIYTAPSKFNFEGYQGDFSSWESVGNWQNVLNEGRDNLSEDAKMEIQALTEKYSTDAEKAREVYEYVQNNTRYVSIQLGIGGFQPFANSVVEETGYGDCKALSFYTQSLLKQAGVESYYTWVYAGNNPPDLDPSFPIDRFNHIILCVPNKGDTLWLECTSQTNPFGYAGRFTGNRDVLLITEGGGKLARTPYYPSEVNTQITTAQIEVDVNLNSTANINISYAGLQYENGNINHVANQGEDDQLKWIEKNITAPGFQLTDFDLRNNRDIIPSVDLSVEFESSKLFNSVGNRYFIQPNLFNRNTYVPDRDSDRRFDISINMGYVDSDSLVFKIPEQLRPEFLPEPTNIESEFGSYSSNLSYENGVLTYVRKVMIKDGTFDKEKYEAFRNFRKSIVRADKQKIAFLKKT